MPIQYTQRNPKPSAPIASFFVSCTHVSNQVLRSYSKRINKNPQNPLTTATHKATTLEDAPPLSTDDYTNLDDNKTTTIEIPTPTFANTTMTEAQKLQAILKQTDDFKKHIRKKKDKSSHVYYYIHQETLDSKFYTKEKDKAQIY